MNENDWLTCWKENDWLCICFRGLFHSAICIKMWTAKLRSTYFRKDVRKIDVFPNISHKTSFIFPQLELSDTMRPADGSYIDKLKEMFPRKKYHLRVGNLQEIKKLTHPHDRYSNLFLNGYINRHVLHVKHFKTD